MLNRLIVVIGVAAMLGGAALVTSRAAHAGGTCHEGNGVSDQAGTTVEMRNNCFNATVTRVDEGATVTFTNKDDVPHTVTGAAFTWGDSNNILKGESVRHTFTESGVYVYSCLVHPGMAGAVVVGDGKGVGHTTVSALGLASDAGDSSTASEAASAASGPPSGEDGNRTVLMSAGIAGAVALVIGGIAGLYASSRASAGRRTSGG
jgi:plastocyanin